LETATPKKARVFTHEDFTLISHIRNYIFNMGFEADYGVWEEGPEEHSSSFGAVLGGLMMWFDQGFYDYKYKNKIEISRYVPVRERMIADGFGALSRVLSRESGTRPYDLSQLSLIWPYNIIDFDTKKTTAAQHRNPPGRTTRCPPLPRGRLLRQRHLCRPR